MSKRLIDTMQRFGLRAEVLGTNEEPSPEGQAIGDLLTHLLETEDENARLRAKCNRLAKVIRGDMERSLQTKYIRDDMKLQTEHDRRSIEHYLGNRGLYLHDVGLKPDDPEPDPEGGK